ncbi:MAG: hypothetical protein WKG00_18245 [Polyangiaceae bacterium]
MKQRTAPRSPRVQVTEAVLYADGHLPAGTRLDALYVESELDRSRGRLVGDPVYGGAMIIVVTRNWVAVNWRGTERLVPEDSVEYLIGGGR